MKRKNSIVEAPHTDSSMNTPSNYTVNAYKELKKTRLETLESKSSSEKLKRTPGAHNILGYWIMFI